jgi:hypothetical protein
MRVSWNLILLEKDYSCGIQAAARVDQQMLGETAARHAAAETKRGGGERGSMERRKSKDFANSIGDLIAADAATATDGGSRKAIEVTSERSES